MEIQNQREAIEEFYFSFIDTKKYFSKINYLMKKIFLCYIITIALITFINGCADETPSNPNTVTNNAPTEPVNPYPADSSIGIDDSTALFLTWESTDPDLNDTLKFDLFAGTSLPLSTIPLAANLTAANYNMGLLFPGVTYYWQIKAKDNHGASSTGALWQFTIRTRP